VRPYDGALNCLLLRWGVGKNGVFNARAESLPGRGLFRTAWNSGQRCLIPALGFYAWRNRAGVTQQAFYVHLDDQDVFGFAGLWDGEACAIMTVPANQLITGIHTSAARMPAIVARGMREIWLFGAADAARGALLPYPDERMIAYPVDPRVNSRRFNDETLIEPLQTDVD
jgi:putative SOS response-associated peptidase YedK